MQEIFTQIYEMGIMPVVKLENAKDAVPLARALREGGLYAAEITFRTDAAAQSIRNIRGEFDDMLLGAGTVLTCAQVDQAVDAGARFIVTPGFNEKVVQHCLDVGIPIIPGCNATAAIELAMEMGLDVLKFFPAEQSGGLAMIKALCAPYAGLRFMPTGGVNAANCKGYLAYPKVIACGGSWITEGSLIRAGRFDEITRLARAAMLDMIDFQLHGVGIGCVNAPAASEAASSLGALFCKDVSERANAFTVGNDVSFLFHAQPKYGTQLDISVSNLDRAAAFLYRRHYALQPETRVYDAAGRMREAVLANTYAGATVRLLAR